MDEYSFKLNFIKPFLSLIIDIIPYNDLLALVLALPDDAFNSIELFNNLPPDFNDFLCKYIGYAVLNINNGNK